MAPSDKEERGRQEGEPELEKRQSHFQHEARRAECLMMSNHVWGGDEQGSWIFLGFFFVLRGFYWDVDCITWIKKNCVILAMLA
jgi:hypothetical protein